MIETGIFYNKDIFAELGLHEPKDWPEFLAIQQRMRDAGYIPMLVEKQAFTDWGVDLTFYQLYRDIAPLLDMRYDPSSGDYLKNYLDWDEIVFLHSKGFFSPQDPRWVQVWRVLKGWRQYMAKNIASTDMLKAFVTRKGAMLWSSSMLVNRLARDPDLDFKWGVFYLPPIPNSFNPFANGYTQCVIGGSGNQYEVTSTALSDTDPNLPLETRMQRSERLKRVVAFLQFLNVPRNTEKVVNEMVSLLPNIKGTEFHPELEPFDRFLQRPYSMTKWYFTFDLQFDEVFARMFELYLNGPNDQATETEFLNWMQRDLDTACERITRRKDLDFKGFEQKWRERAAERKKTPGLPPSAY
jgi:raffinose/stachyose/melibiose transport system substrate-binding protein